MKPFDLKAALEGKPVQRHNGKEVPHIHVLPDWAEDFFPVISKDVDGIKESHTIEGRTTKYPNDPHDLDLFMADEEVVEYWLLNDREGTGNRWFNRFQTLADALFVKETQKFCIGLQKVTLTNGKITKAEVI
jgi:hypothetical protein